MKQMINNLLKLGIIAFFLSSCGKKASNIMVPENASLVFHINAASLSSKLSWDEIKNSEWFKMAAKEGPGNDLERKLLDNPEASGIDINSDFYIFMEMRGNNAYVVAQGKLKDVKAYEAMITKAGDNKEIKKQGGFSYTGNKEGLITWTKDRFIFVGQSSDFNPGNNNYYGNRSENSLTMDSVLKYANDLYNLKKSNSIGNDSRFASIINEKGDMHFWLNAGSMIKKSIPMDLGGLFKATSLLEGNATGYTLNFDNGKITASTKSWFNKELSAFFKKNKPGNINTEMLQRISEKEVCAVFAMNYPPEGLKDLLKLFGVDGLLNGFMGTVGLSIDDFVKANKGDLLLAVSDFSVQDKTKSYEYGDSPIAYSKAEPDAKILFATSINDKASFDKLADVLKNAIGKQRETEELEKIKYTVKDNWFIAGNSQESVDGFAAGKKTDHTFINKISGHPLAGFIDLQKILGSIQTKEAEGVKNLLSGDGNIWENIIFYGGEMNSGAITGYFEVNMIDKNTNSLKQFNNYISILAKTIRSNRDFDMNDREYPKIDTATVLPPQLPD